MRQLGVLGAVTAVSQWEDENRLALMDSSRRTAYTAAGSKIDALSWASEASSNDQVDGEERKGRPAWVVTSISQPVYTVCVCVCAVWKRKEETDRCLAQLYTPIGASAMIVSMKGGSDLHHLCCFYFPVLLESDTDTHRQHPHTHTRHTDKRDAVQTGVHGLDKSQTSSHWQNWFLYKSFLFRESSFWPEPAENPWGSLRKKTKWFNGWRQDFRSVFLKYLQWQE